MADLFAEMSRRYHERNVPWDHELPPPEVIDVVSRLAPGRALDLGSGYGRACIYLARHGWQCDGVDFVPEAVAVAEQRAYAAGVADRVRFHCGSVTHLSFLKPPYQLAIDVGCLHAQPGDALGAYASGVARLLEPGGVYLLFMRLADNAAADAPRGLSLATVSTVFTPDFLIERVEQSVTVMPDASWESAWLWMRRRAGENESHVTQA